MSLLKNKYKLSSERKSLYKGPPEKALVVGVSKTGGRNNLGRITAWHRGGGSRKKYRMIDFKRNKFGLEATVERFEYDPNRSAFIALIRYKDGEISYILAPQKLKVGDKVISGNENIEASVGNAMPMKNMPIGTIVHNIELKIGGGGKLARSAGCYAQLMEKDQDYALLKLSSGEIRKVSASCMATVGAVSNAEHHNRKIGKAGRSRWLGRKPVVRGVVMNPIDHPHGGGEGRTSGGRHPVTPWGKSTKGKRTRKSKSSDKFIVKRRYNK